MYRFLIRVVCPVLFVLAVHVWFGACSQVLAEVRRFEVLQRTPFAGGISFGDAGPYQRLSGRVHFAVDPSHLQNQNVVDLRNAPAGEDGLVEFSADLEILAPQDLSRACGAALYDVNNRGNKLALRFFNDSRSGNDLSDAGSGFLMNHGWIVVWSGWDGELLPGNSRLQLHAPVARTGGSPITGRVRYEICVSSDGRTRVAVNGSGHGAYRPTERGLERASLTWRLKPDDPRVGIPREQFHLYCRDVPSRHIGQLPNVELELPAGFQKGYLYELIYEAQDPLVHGLSFASVRDLVSALRYGDGSGNPLLNKTGRPVVTRTHIFGVSQSGRFIREFLYAGFHRDENQRLVFDSMIPHVAGGGLGSFNHRFAQPTTYNTQHEYHQWASDRFPFTYASTKDPVTGRVDGLLPAAAHDSSGQSARGPFVLHTQTTSEYWHRSGSLAHTTPDSKADAAVPDNVRFYTFGGTQHGPANWPPTTGSGQTPANPADYRPFLRALLLAADRWAAGGPPPPPSRYPRLIDKTLVEWSQASTQFPPVPGIRYPQVIQQPLALNHGPRWQTQGIIDVQPPESIGRYSVLVPVCDSDGNERGCLNPPEVEVPLATFTGWSLRSPEAGAQNQLLKLTGSRIPFSVTAFERRWSGDPRPAVQQRYAAPDAFRQQLKTYCDQLVREGYLLADDAEAIVRRQMSRARPLFERIDRETVRRTPVRKLPAERAGEGPAWHPEYGLLFSGGGDIRQLDLNGRQRIWRAMAGTNGLLFDREKRLVACEPVHRRVTRTESDGTVVVLTDSFEGQPYNQPNDLTIDSQGRIYFSDPCYGPRDQIRQRDATGRAIEGVYRIDTDGRVARIITHEADRPNGLLVTPDDRYLFVADNNNNTVDGARRLWRFELQADGTIRPASKTLIYDWRSGRGPDGMAMDLAGNLYVAGGRNRPVQPYETAVRHPGGIYVFSPDGHLIDVIEIPADEVTNCTFGGRDRRTLFITAGGTLWSVQTQHAGYLLYQE